MHSKKHPAPRMKYGKKYDALCKRGKRLCEAYTDACEELVRKGMTYRVARANANLIRDLGFDRLDIKVYVDAKCQMYDAKYAVIRQGKVCQELLRELTKTTNAIRDIEERHEAKRRMPWRPDREEAAKKKGRGRGPSASPVRK